MKIRLILAFSCVLILPSILLGSCSSLASNSPVQPTGVAQTTVTPTGLSVTPTIQPDDKPVTKLVVWLPDQFLERNPSVLLSIVTQQVAEYTTKHPTVSVDVRIKKNTGSANLMDSLQNASLAAPTTLPDLVLLNRDEMEVAALKGLLIPFDGTTDLMSANDWIEPVRQLATIQGSTFGIPAAADALVYISPQDNDDLEPPLTANNPVLCYLNDPQALVPMSLYLAAGGTLADETGKPSLEATTLITVLNQVNTARTKGALPAWVMDISQPGDVFRYYASGRGDRMIAWHSDTDPSILGSTKVSVLPTGLDRDASLIRGWFWTMTQPDPNRRMESVALAEALSDEAFLVRLEKAARLMPVRRSPAVLEDPKLSSLADIVAGGQPIPDGLFLVTISPIFQDAIRQTFAGDLTPEEIALQVLERIQR